MLTWNKRHFSVLGSLISPTSASRQPSRSQLEAEVHGKRMYLKSQEDKCVPEYPIW